MCNFVFRYYAGWADKNHGKTIPVGECIVYGLMVYWKTMRDPLFEVASVV